MEVNVEEGCLGHCIMHFLLVIVIITMSVQGTRKVLQLSKNVTNHMRHLSPVPHDIFMVPRPRDPVSPVGDEAPR